MYFYLLMNKDFIIIIINNLTLLDDNDARNSTSYSNNLFLSDTSKD